MSDIMMRCAICVGGTGQCTGACRIPYMPQVPYQPGFAEVLTKGCICPPTAEKTCQRWDCGRKTPSPASLGVQAPNLAKD